LAAAKTVATSVYHRGGSGGGGDKREDGYPRAGTASAAAARLVRAVAAWAGSHGTNYCTYSAALQINIGNRDLLMLYTDGYSSYKNLSPSHVLPKVGINYLSNQNEHLIRPQPIFIPVGVTRKVNI
jgi:hypothetical protein